jgi:hypothetical protein
MYKTYRLLTSSSTFELGHSYNTGESRPRTKLARYHPIFRAYRSINLTALVGETCVRIGGSKGYGKRAVEELWSQQTRAVWSQHANRK